VDVEPVGEAQGVSLFQIGFDIFLVYDGMKLIGKQYVDDIRLFGRLRGGGAYLYHPYPMLRSIASHS